MLNGSRNALYGVSLDPLTNGHLWMIERGASMYEKLVVGIGINPKKNYTFPIETRMEMSQKCVEHLPNVEVVSIGLEFLVRYARRNGISESLRGLRTSTDFQYESEMAAVNADIAPEVTTVMVVCPPDLAKISSSMVKGLVGYDDWEQVLELYVPSPVYLKMTEMARKKSGLLK